MHSRWSFTAALSNSIQCCSFLVYFPELNSVSCNNYQSALQKTFFYILKKSRWLKGFAVFRRTRCSISDSVTACVNVDSLTDRFQELLMFLSSGAMLDIVPVFRSELFLLVSCPRWGQISFYFLGHRLEKSMASVESCCVSCSNAVSSNIILHLRFPTVNIMYYWRNDIKEDYCTVRSAWCSYI